MKPNNPFAELENRRVNIGDTGSDEIYQRVLLDYWPKGNWFKLEDMTGKPYWTNRVYFASLLTKKQEDLDVESKK